MPSSSPPGDSRAQSIVRRFVASKTTEMKLAAYDESQQEQERQRRSTAAGGGGSSLSRSAAALAGGHQLFSSLRHRSADGDRDSSDGGGGRAARERAATADGLSLFATARSELLRSLPVRSYIVAFRQNNSH